MNLHVESVEYTSDGAPVSGYFARPARVEEALPGILVIQEVWGVDGHIQDLVRRFATSGYAALAPDLYSHGGRKPAALAPERVETAKSFLDTIPPSAWMNPSERDAALARLPAPQRRGVGETLGALFSPNRPVDQYLSDLRAGLAYLRGHRACLGHRVGSIGYCMGGMLSALLACSEPALSAAVVYYGMSPGADRIAGIRCPILGLYGGDDPRITNGVPEFAESMRAAGKSFEHHVYPGAPHAFFNDERRSYRVAAARDAWARTLGFFTQHLAQAT
jgi:carboxymethylenebutenolidase